MVESDDELAESYEDVESPLLKVPLILTLSFSLRLSPPQGAGRLQRDAARGEPITVRYPESEGEGRSQAIPVGSFTTRWSPGEALPEVIRAVSKRG